MNRFLRIVIGGALFLALTSFAYAGAGQETAAEKVIKVGCAVSLSGRAQITQALVLARVAAEVLSRMPRRKALSLWNTRPSSVLSCPGREGTMSAGRPSFR